MAQVDLRTVAHLDIYSCFPSAVQTACVELGLGDRPGRELTQTGGLPYHGGPGNNFALHSIGAMVEKLREHPGEFGLVTANGGFMSKHSLGLYSTTRFNHSDPARIWQRPNPAALQQEVGRLGAAP